MSKETFSTLIHSDTPVLVDFFAEWCGPCKMMAPVFEQVKQSFGHQLRIIKIDIDKNPQVASAYQIVSVPTLVLFRNGKTLWRQSGAMHAAQLENIIRTHIITS